MTIVVVCQETGSASPTGPWARAVQACRDIACIRSFARRRDSQDPREVAARHGIEACTVARESVLGSECCDQIRSLGG